MASEIELAHERDSFIEFVSQGISETQAAFAVGWNPRQLRAELLNPDFGDLVDFARDRANGLVEEALFEKARQGEGWAVQMWLYNRAPERWKDRRQINVQQDTRIQVSVVRSVVEGAKELMGFDIAALQPGGALDNNGVIDAEVVDDDGG